MGLPEGVLAGTGALHASPSFPSLVLLSRVTRLFLPGPDKSHTQPGERWCQARWLELAWDLSGVHSNVKSQSSSNKRLLQAQGRERITIGGVDSDRYLSYVLITGWTPGAFMREGREIIARTEGRRFCGCRRARFLF